MRNERGRAHWLWLMVTVEPTRRLSEVQFVAFDLETTGLSPHDCRIVEFGAIRFQLDGTVLERFEQLVDPECSIPRSATRIHGITDAMISGMPTVAETLPRYLDFLGQDNSVSLVAFCHADKMEKTFRLDRIRELRIEDRGPE